MTFKVGDWVEFTVMPAGNHYDAIGKIVGKKVKFVDEKLFHWIREYGTGFSYYRATHEIRKLTDEEIMIILLEKYGS